MKYVVAGTAGHIDHGKSALVRALTGTDPDRLEEEKRRGITIDLGFAHLDLSHTLRVAFIDVPGHERFIKNMLAGAGGIDLVILVVAADESIKPQTREHFDICKLLGVKKGIVAITKCDLVEPEIADLVRLEVQELVAGSFLEGAPTLSVSAKTGAGLERLKAELSRLGLETASRSSALPFRLPIDRAFVMKGFGSVVTGTLTAGTIELEAEAEIYPSGRRVRVRGIEVHNQPAARAEAGQRTALNLAGVETKEIRRGMTLGPPGLFRATSQLDGALTLLASAPPLKNRSSLHFHSGTMETVAEVVLLEGKELQPGGKTYAQFRLKEPGLLLPGDRFIIRRFSPVTTIGGGVVLDGLAPRHRAGDRAVIEMLRILESGDDESRLEAFAREAGEAATEALAARLGRSPAETAAIANRLEGKGKLKTLGREPGTVVHAAHFDQAAARLLSALERFHATNPLVEGMMKEELRGRAAAGSRRDSVSPALFNALLQNLEARGKVEMQGEAVRLPGRGSELTAEEEAAKDHLVEVFQNAGLAVPREAEVLAKLKVDRARAVKLLLLLLRQKVLVRLSADLVFHHSALAWLRARLLEQKAKDPRLTVATFKEITGLSRKYAIPLLEYLDRERVTRRDGADRIIL
jgi:selenocysteine-specific elongation factor